MKTQKGIDTHNAIVSAAAELFMEKSVHKVSVSDIVKRAGIAKGTFYIYFESKDDLVWHFLEHELESVVVWFDNFEVIGYEEAAIDEIIHYILDYIQNKMSFLKMIHHVKFHSFFGQSKIKKRFEKEWMEPVRIWIEKGNRLGKLSIADPAFTARFISLAIHDMIDEIITEDSVYTLGTFGEKLKDLLIKLLY